MFRLAPRNETLKRTIGRGKGRGKRGRRGGGSGKEGRKGDYTGNIVSTDTRYLEVAKGSVKGEERNGRERERRKRRYLCTPAQLVVVAS